MICIEPIRGRNITPGCLPSPYKVIQCVLRDGFQQPIELLCAFVSTIVKYAIPSTHVFSVLLRLFCRIDLGHSVHLALTAPIAQLRLIFWLILGSA